MVLCVCVWERVADHLLFLYFSWVNQKTEGKIPQIVEGELSPDTKIVMASALYFNARWEKSFFEGTTAL